MKKNSPFFILAALFLLNFLAWRAVFGFSDQGSLKAVFFDVGQGDSVFLETPCGHQILIDGGPDSSVLEKLSEQMPFWDRSLDLIVLSHPEKDHITGLLSVLESYKVENVLWSGIVRETSEYEKWKELIEKEGAGIYIARAGQKISFSGFCPESSARILFPFQSLEGREFSNVNNTSLFLKFSFKETSFLFAGDAYKSLEKQVARRYSLDSDVLKVSHHGSKTSSAREFIAEVLPEYAVIQCGKENPYGHPHQETLSLLEEFGAKVLRNDLEGDIVLRSNGFSLKAE